MADVRRDRLALQRNLIRAAMIVRGMTPPPRAEPAQTIARKYDPRQLRNPLTGEWTDTPGGGVITDPLKLADRLRLNPGERFRGSATVGDGSGNSSLAMARVDTPDGPVLRLSSMAPEDVSDWDGADSIDLDETAVRQLRDLLDGTAEAGKDSVTDYYRRVRSAHAARLPPDDDGWPDPEAMIADGVISAGDGRIEWRLQRDADAGPELAGIDAPGAGWSLALDIQRGGATYATDPFYLDRPARVRALEKALDRLMAAS